MKVFTVVLVAVSSLVTCQFAISLRFVNGFQASGYTTIERSPRAGDCITNPLLPFCVAAFEQSSAIVTSVAASHVVIMTAFVLFGVPFGSARLAIVDIGVIAAGVVVVLGSDSGGPASTGP
ncbi:hypothetical protein BIW11_08351 [Tropilaelaps mercedesae]|uniref:Uncharacterized protein n=1 Tax=Tropilaelaps mercedesae TaxID=418985 RepID=A0A1V9XPZ3_9ACAR|nr:hypothetical protein BIW11_08351 [Tropilaelaps mercedesae]